MIALRDSMFSVTPPHTLHAHLQREKTVMVQSYFIMTLFPSILFQYRLLVWCPAIDK